MTILIIYGKHKLRGRLPIKTLNNFKITKQHLILIPYIDSRESLSLRNKFEVNLSICLRIASLRTFELLMLNCQIIPLIGLSFLIVAQKLLD